MSLTKRAFNYAKPYKSSFITAIIFNLLYALFNVVALAFMMPILSVLFGEENNEVVTKPIYSGKLDDLKQFFSDYSAYYMNEVSQTEGPIYVLAISCVIFIVAFLFRNIFSFLSETCLVDLRSGVTRDLRVDIHNKIIDLPVAYFTEKRKGDMINRISSDVNEVESNILNSIVEIVRSPIMIIVFVGVLFTVSYQLTIFAILVFPIMGTIISLIGKSLKKAAAHAQDELSNIITYVDETLTSLKIIKIFNAEDQVKGRFDESINRYRKYLQKVMKKRALASPTSEFLGAVTIGLIVFFGGKLSLEGNGLTGSQFIFYIATFYTLLDPIKKFSKALSDVQKGEVSAQRIFEVLDADVSIQDLPNAKGIEAFEDKIEFRNVTFAYGKHDVIKDFNLTINKGETVALVGQSGSGKSTLANLITRFWDVKSGQILIDGIDIKHIKLHDYRLLFGLVTQDSILFNDTIFNNISLGDKSPSEEKVVSAARIANAEEFIIKMPEKYQESVGEGGSKLSGGQKQRLSIARAVYKNPPIMVLDEATSALDTKSEKLVQVALNNMMQNRTSLVIAHRLSTIQNADKIVVMEAGKIIEEGNHHSLIEKKGVYANLVNMQNFE
ncbi:ABC transporter ATP-binding protein/permease [Empedobacter stercoris]|uniref:ABC transporter ATP-binding protein/permease n=1 Tax=Empedobacter falsenii TaxID=343874 RepID=A0ABY8V3D3_9FLAO|nr:MULTISPECIES: ABC transporter transmembrane domain-containing protein [Empedobacter]MCA4775916.1 ATP-binding cassette domain-containing protein [Empedobacter stercoris]MCA4810011.1 ATP-binding cassette domain-containing protein [Empedobacter stercoris]MDM1523164.1 ATP-binding cassette domain-containing protein [Empedobacter sp. 225-1]MDM1543108.1 ATP-binding cassette domain-containing protein [Empedobacter sp. 189-2]QNT15439.1 ATP-binding cassette domain-containing protein [Empedobacter ste